MIAEAVDAALAVGWALLVWVVLLAGAATAAVYAGLLAVWGIWRVLRSAWGAAGLRRPQEAAGAPQAPSRAYRDAGPSPAALREALSASALQTQPKWSKT